MIEKIDYSKIFGIQIEDKMLRVVEIDKNKKRINISGYVKRKLGTGVVIKGIVRRKRLLAQIIKRAMRDCSPSPIKKKNVICSVPERKSFIKIIEVPNMEEKELQEAIKWEMEDNIPLPVEKVYLDWKVIKYEEEKKKMQVMIAAAHKEVIDSRIETLEHAGLIPFGIEPDSFALAKCFENKEEKDKKLSLIIYFGSDKSVILVKRCGNILFSSSILFSVTELKNEISKTLSEDIKGKVKMEKKQKEVLKSIDKYGFDKRHKKGEKNFMAAEIIVKELLREVKSALNYFEGREKSESINQIFLSGEGAGIKGMDTLFFLGLGKEVKVNKELQGHTISHGALVIPKEEIADFAIAVGNALG